MADYGDRDLSREAADWLDKITASQKRQDAWEKDAEGAEKVYSADKEGRATAFNILHSNVETIVPAIYNSTPVPDIRPRFDKDPAAKEFGEAISRCVSVMVDDNKLDKEIEAGARDAYLSGRDIVRIRFEAQSGEALEGEKITFEAVSWRDFRHGPAKRWDDVQWIAFAHRLPEEEVEEFEDPEMVRAQMVEPIVSDEEDDITVWEIWDKKSRSIKWLKEDGTQLIREDDDPLGLPGFFPCPEPVQPITLTGKLCPVCPYTIYRKLADELDTITRRINKIIAGLKVRGIAVGLADDLAALANLEDWQLAPATGTMEQMAQLKGLEGAIAWWPIDKAVAVLEQLYVARETCKQTIYEVTGISDIVRGQSEANETATAQQIKTQWGSIRIQRMQKLIERQVRDIFVMMTDVICRRFRPERIQELSGLQLTPEVMMLLQRPVLAHYRVDVESDSTIRADLTRQKQEMAAFLEGTAQYFATMQPVVTAAPQMAGPATDIYASFARIFRLGKQAEDALDQMGDVAKQAAEQPPPNPEAMKAEAEAQKLQAEMQAKGAELELKREEMGIKAQSEAQKMELEREKMALEVQKAAMELEIKRAELQLKQQEMVLKERQAELDAVMTVDAADRADENAEADRKARADETKVKAKSKAA